MEDSRSKGLEEKISRSFGDNENNVKIKIFEYIPPSSFLNDSYDSDRALIKEVIRFKNFLEDKLKTKPDSILKNPQYPIEFGIWCLTKGLWFSIGPWYSGRKKEEIPRLTFTWKKKISLEREFNIKSRCVEYSCTAYLALVPINTELDEEIPLQEKFHIKKKRKKKNFLMMEGIQNWYGFFRYYRNEMIQAKHNPKKVIPKVIRSWNEKFIDYCIEKKDLINLTKLAYSKEPIDEIRETEINIAYFESRRIFIKFLEKAKNVCSHAYEKYILEVMTEIISKNKLGAAVEENNYSLRFSTKPFSSKPFFISPNYSIAKSELLRLERKE